MIPRFACWHVCWGEVAVFVLLSLWSWMRMVPEEEPVSKMVEVVFWRGLVDMAVVVVFGLGVKVECRTGWGGEVVKCEIVEFEWRDR